MTNEALFSLRKGSIGERTKRAVKTGSGASEQALAVGGLIHYHD